MAGKANNSNAVIDVVSAANSTVPAHCFCLDAVNKNADSRFQSLKAGGGAGSCVSLIQGKFGRFCVLAGGGANGLPYAILIRIGVSIDGRIIIGIRRIEGPTITKIRHGFIIITRNSVAVCKGVGIFISENKTPTMLQSNRSILFPNLLIQIVLIVPITLIPIMIVRKIGKLLVCHRLRHRDRGIFVTLKIIMKLMIQIWVRSPIMAKVVVGIV